MQFGFAYAPPLIIGAAVSNKVFDNGLMFALNMLVNTERGDTFSFNEIKSWLEEAGFKNARTLEAGTVATTAGNQILAIVDRSVTIPNKTVML